MAVNGKKLRSFELVSAFKLFVLMLIFMLKVKATRLEELNALIEDEIHQNIECPASSENSACPCYKFEDGK